MSSGRDCDRGSDGQRGCDDLGVCQARPGCPSPAAAVHHDTSSLPPGGFWFAPGVIDEPPPHEPLSWWEMALIVLVASGVGGLAAAVATMWAKGLL